MCFNSRLVNCFSLCALAAFVFACEPTAYPESGSCAVDSSALVDCSVKKQGADPVSAEDAGVTAYVCNGTARPDGSPQYIDGMPIGIACDDKGEVEGAGHAFCCSKETAHCAFDPTGECDDESYSSYQCFGTRPDFVNPLLYCRQGLKDGGYISYCCRDKSLSTPVAGAAGGWCTKDLNSANACTPGLDNWTCAEGQVPTSEMLPNSGSRADFYAPMCSATGPADTKGQTSYCCFTPKLPPEGASCEASTNVPDCGYRRFGFACFGVDKPSDYHPPMICNEPGISGKSDGGYPATLYCCDYDLTLAAAVTTPSQ